MTELVSVARLVRTVAFGSYAAPVALNGCRITARSESVTRAGEQASLIAPFRDTRESAVCKVGSEFVDGCNRRETGHTSAPSRFRSGAHNPTECANRGGAGVDNPRVGRTGRIRRLSSGGNGMSLKTMNQTEEAFVNACLEFGAEVTIGEKVILVANPNNGERNTQSRLANTQTFETPTRAARAVCENLGL